MSPCMVSLWRAVSRHTLTGCAKTCGVFSSRWRGKWSARGHDVGGHESLAGVWDGAGSMRSMSSAQPLRPAASFAAGSEAYAIMRTLRSLKGEHKTAYFDSIAKQNKANIFHCNAMLAGCATPQRARDFLLRMRDLGIAPDVVSYTTIMQLEIKAPGGSIGAAEALFREMKALNPPIAPNVRTHMVLIEGHGKHGRLEDAVAAWQRMLADGLAANEYIYTALIDACAKRMDVDAADRILDAALSDKLVKPNVQMFTAMIDLNARAGRGGKVKALWRDMMAAGVVLDTTAVNTAITSLDKAVGLEEAVALFHEVQASNCVALNCVTYSALIDAYAKRGLVSEASAVFQAMRAREIEPDAALFVSLIDLYGKCGALDLAEEKMEALLDYAKTIVHPPPPPRA